MKTIKQIPPNILWEDPVEEGTVSDEVNFDVDSII